MWPEYSLLNFASAVLKYIQSMNQKQNKTQKKNQESTVQDDSLPDSASSQEPVKTIPENQQIDSFVSDKETKRYSTEKLISLLRQQKQSWIKARSIQDWVCKTITNDWLFYTLFATDRYFKRELADQNIEHRLLWCG